MRARQRSIGFLLIEQNTLFSCMFSFCISNIEREKQTTIGMRKNNKVQENSVDVSSRVEEVAEALI